MLLRVYDTLGEYVGVDPSRYPQPTPARDVPGRDDE